MIRFISWTPRIRSTTQSLDMDGSDVAKIMKFRATQVDNASTSMALSIALDYAPSFAIDPINAQSTIALLQQIEQQHPAAARIDVICDKARYYHSQLVTEYLLDAKIELILLPPYAPNLNLVER